MFISALVLMVSVAQTLPPWMTGESKPENLRVSLVTFSPGDTLTEWWGHSALVVEDLSLNQGRLYNYGMFSFDEGFVHRFVQGRLEFWVSDDPINATYRLYQALKRDIRVQELNLLPEQALQLARALGTNVLPQNRVYLYHHYNDNCSTRPRDLIDAALGGQLVAFQQRTPSSLTLRQLTRRYSSVNVPMSVVLDYLQNDELDGPMTRKEAAFLPDELERDLNVLRVKRPDGSEVPAVKKQWNVFTSTRKPPPAEAPNLILPMTAFSAFFAGLVLLLGHWGRDGKRLPRIALGGLHVLLGLTWGTLGVFLFVVGLFTNHTVAHRNENLFFINPVTFALLPLGAMLMFGSSRAKRGLRWTCTVLAALSVLGVMVKVLPPFNQDNWNIIAIAAPVNVALAALFWLDARRQFVVRSSPAASGKRAADEPSSPSPHG
jgi:hypothetical protein